MPWDSPALWFNAGLIAVADWLASDEHAFPPSTVLTPAEIEARAVRQLGSIGFQPLALPTGRDFTALFGFAPLPLQVATADSATRPGVYIVEGPMGCGKTEAALVAADNLLSSGQAVGLYFALPTQTTSNRIHRRVGEFLHRLDPAAATRLIHGGSWLLADSAFVAGTQEGAPQANEGRHDGRDWFASTRRALLAPFGVGTVDQALLGVVAAKHFFVRQYALAGKVVVLDEVHSYDLYTGTLIAVLIRRLRELQATVIVLSATLTAAQRRNLLGLTGGVPVSMAYPLLSMQREGELELSERGHRRGPAGHGHGPHGHVAAAHRQALAPLAAAAARGGLPSLDCCATTRCPRTGHGYGRDTEGLLWQERQGLRALRAAPQPGSVAPAGDSGTADRHPLAAGGDLRRPAGRA